MTHEEVVAYVRKHFGRMVDDFGLSHWEIHVCYERLDKAAAQCETHFEYEQASITFDTENFRNDGEEYLRKVIEHELCHIVHAPMMMLLDLAKPTMDEYQYSMLVEGWHKAQELTVVQIERTVRNVRKTEAARHRPKPGGAPPLGRLFLGG